MQAHNAAIIFDLNFHAPHTDLEGFQNP